MSTIGNHRLKALAGLAALALVMGISLPNAHAQLSATNYSGRYACAVSSDDNFYTAIVKYGPNGQGAYAAGTLIAAANAFVAFPTVSPSGDYCIYTLDTTSSSYNIGSDGMGFESLSWVSTGPNNSTLGCPSSFVDQTAIGLLGAFNASATTQRSEFVDANLLGEDEPGHGHCLK
jgi:hypothetical protein